MLHRLNIRWHSDQDRQTDLSSRLEATLGLLLLLVVTLYHSSDLPPLAIINHPVAVNAAEAVPLGVSS